MARKYGGIWTILKRDYICSIAAHPSLHARFIKAVIKEKDRDVGFKILKASYSLEVKLQCLVEGSKITFRLQEHISFKHISAKDF